MKRKQRLPTAKPRTDLRVERDVATGRTSKAARTPENRYSTAKLPHEHDESTHPPAKPNAITEQAAQDVKTGKVDTDCYGATGDRYDRKQRQR